MLPGVVELDERAAIIAEGCGIGQEDAAAQALAEFGFVSLDELLGSWLAAWSTEIRRLSDPVDRHWAALRTASLMFLTTPHARAALQAGWSEIELWGVPPGDDARWCFGSKGLLPAVVWAPWPGTRLSAIDADGAGIVTGSGARLRHRRTCQDVSGAVPWWLHPALTAGGSQR
jgi:hypothetical protein